MTLRPPVQTIVDTCRYLIDSDNVDTSGSSANGGAAACIIQ